MNVIENPNEPEVERGGLRSFQLRRFIEDLAGMDSSTRAAADQLGGIAEVLEGNTGRAVPRLVPSERSSSAAMGSRTRRRRSGSNRTPCYKKSSGGCATSRTLSMSRAPRRPANRWC
jgi:hypothetical protein